MQTRNSRKPLSVVKSNQAKKTIIGNKSSKVVKQASKPVRKTAAVVTKVQNPALPAQREETTESLFFPHEDNLQSFRYSLGGFEDENLIEEEEVAATANKPHPLASHSALLFDSLPISPIQKEPFIQDDFASFLHESHKEEEQDDKYRKQHPSPLPLSNQKVLSLKNHDLKNISNHSATPGKKENNSYDDPFGLIASYKPIIPSASSASLPSTNASQSSLLNSSSSSSNFLKNLVNNEDNDDDDDNDDDESHDENMKRFAGNDACKSEEENHFEPDSLGDDGTSLDSFDFLLAPGQVAEDSPKPVKARKIVLIRQKGGIRRKKTRK